MCRFSPEFWTETPGPGSRQPRPNLMFVLILLFFSIGCSAKGTWKINLKEPLHPYNITSAIMPLGPDEYRMVLSNYNTNSGLKFGDAWLFKVNRAGIIESQIQYQRAKDEFVLEAQLTSEGGLAMVGYNYLPGKAPFDLWASKLDQEGHTLWKRVMEDKTKPRVISITETSDSGVLLAEAGWQEPLNVVKLDRNGVIEWSFCGNEHGYDIKKIILKETNEHHYVLCGSPSYVLMMNSNGHLLWKNRITNSTVQSMDIAAEGGVVLGGQVGEDHEPHAWVAVWDCDGQTINEQTLANRTPTSITAITALKQGGYLVGGVADDKSQGYLNTSAWVSRLDQYLKPLWQRTFPKYGRNTRAIFVAEDRDQGLLVSVYIEHESHEREEDTLWVFKLDSKGRIQDQEIASERMKPVNLLLGQIILAPIAYPLKWFLEQYP